MQSTSTAPLVRLGPLAIVLAVLGLLAMPAPTTLAADSQLREAVAMPSASWHGRAIQKPLPPPRLRRTRWPKGWSAGSVGFGTGYGRPGGSDRVREVQRRLTKLGYRPGPLDGLFGPRTQAATRWFQYKHGLRITGRVTRPTIIVLQARSDHKPLPTKPKPATKTKTKTKEQTKPPKSEPNPETHVVTPAPTPQAPPTAGANPSVTWLIAGLLILLALVLGALTSLVVPELRRLRKGPASPAAKPAPALLQPKPAPAPPPQRAPAHSRPAPRVLGYATVNGQDQARDTATASVALLCNYRGWSLIEVVHDRRDPARGLTDRPGLMYAVNALRGGGPAGLVVAHLRDFTSRIADLATLLNWLAEADAFLGAADHELDTSTRAGKSTATAIIELGRWERRRIAERTRADLVRGRFTPNGRPTDVEIAQQIAAMSGQGLSLRAIADALNIVGIPGPYGHSRWHPTHVKAATEERHRA